MIYDASTFSFPLGLSTDLVVVGAGAGGLAAAMAAAEAGVKTLIIEGGEYLTPADMSQREEEMFPRLFQQSGSQTTVDHAVKVLGKQEPAHFRNGFLGFGVAPVALLARPDRILIKLDVLLGDYAKYHGGQPPVAHGERLGPRARRLFVPELERVIILGETQATTRQRNQRRDSD